MENKSNKQRKQERFDDNLAHWIAYWRANPHRFVTEYLMNTNGLFLFQKILIYFMFKSDLFLFIAARGSQCLLLVEILDEKLREIGKTLSLV